MKSSLSIVATLLLALQIVSLGKAMSQTGSPTAKSILFFEFVSSVDRRKVFELQVSTFGTETRLPPTLQANLIEPGKAPQRSNIRMNEDTLTALSDGLQKHGVLDLKGNRLSKIEGLPAPKPGEYFVRYDNGHRQIEISIMGQTPDNRPFLDYLRGTIVGKVYKDMTGTSL